MTIIHNSLFARASNKDYLGNWNLLLGNILEFLLDYEIAVYLDYNGCQPEWCNFLYFMTRGAKNYDYTRLCANVNTR